MSRVMPLAPLCCLYERELSIYPDRIRVPMEDGRVVYYRLDDKAMHPSMEAALKSLIRIPQREEGRHQKKD